MTRCEVIPEANHEVAFLIDGVERTRWHFGTQYPRPFFYPFTGPSGRSLTRMGHPGAPNHDHHQSIWFAHYKVLGINFWNNQSDAYVRQIQWLAYEDGADEARMAASLGWYDGHDPAPLMTQELIVAVRPSGDQETELEVQSRFVPTAESLELQKTNFGFLGVRVARHISAVFGGGTVTSSAGQSGGAKVHEQIATWMDYSGQPAEAADSREGITYFDHPQNIGQPSLWHVRDDGWMCASPCQRASVTTTKSSPLELRYLLLAHRGGADAPRFDALHKQFAQRPKLVVKKSAKPHHFAEITRTV